MSTNTTTSVTNTANTETILQGIFWKIASCACFASINGIVKILTIQDLNVKNILFWQNLIALLFLLPLVINSFRKSNILDLKINTGIKWQWWHLLRISCAVSGMLLWYLSLKYFPMAQAMALTSVGPIISVLGAVFILGEKLNHLRALAITVSFVGAMCILRPDYGNLILSNQGIVMLFPMASAFCFSFSRLATRKLAQSGIPASYLALFLMVGMVPVTFGLALYVWQWPTISQAYYLLLLGAFAAIAHYTFSKAYAYAEVTLLMPVGFVKFLLSLLTGYMLFSELPSHVLHWIGIGCIFISSLFIHFDLYKK